MSIVQDYLDLTKKYKAIYGEQTLVLMEVGSFFEVYALANTVCAKPNANAVGAKPNANAVGPNAVVAKPNANAVGPNPTYIGSNIEDFAKMNDMIIAKKPNVLVNKLPVVMAGMGTAHADKYIQKLQEHGYTIVIYKQDMQNKTVRSLAEIISPGTYFPSENDSIGLSNNVMCIWLHKSKMTKTMPSQLTIGLGNIDIFTGKTALFQFQVNHSSHSSSTYDELERYIAAYNPSECLIVSNIEERLVHEIVGYVGLEYTKIHKVFLDANVIGANVIGANVIGANVIGANAMETFAKNAEKQIYQIAILKKFFPHLSAFHEMFPTHAIAIQSFCFLLDFVDQHNPNLVKKLTDPVFENYTDRLILSNHSLSQLNIIDDTRHTGKCRSVSSLLNNCVTTMGQRQFMYNLHYPITKPMTLQASYDITEHFLHKGEAYFLSIRQHLNAMTDLEKFTRKIVTRKLMPKNFTALDEDLTRLTTLYRQLEGDDVLKAYTHGTGCHKETLSMCQVILTDVRRVFNLDACRNLSDISDTTYIFNRGISSSLDALLKTSLDGNCKLIAICNYLSLLIQQTEKKVTPYVKIHETAKSPATLVCTSRRTVLLKAAIKQRMLATHTESHKHIHSISYQSKYSQTEEVFELDLSTLEYTTNGSSKTEMVITSKQIRELTSSNEEIKIKLLKEMQVVFQNYLSEFAKFMPQLTHITKYVTEMDMLQCKAYTAHKYNYCKPTIAGDPPMVCVKSFFEFTGIRHPLIEHLQTNEIYVTNDMALGQSPSASEAANASGAGPRPSPSASEAANASEAASENANGILLYGTNAVGKTSFIKSVGIAIIMAQAGLYVPCNSFTYAPYRNIFTRILGNDNLFKGLSTFAVEMTELRTILTMANAHSLVLGDELCSGTESDSALSIFTAGLEILHEKECAFIFATHLHEINKYEEIKALTKMKMMHMAVHYNKETNLLVYDRKLREGPGESMYGLEVCKSLNLPDAFLKRAHDIRMKYHPEKQNVLSLSATHYNAKKLVGNCELCQNHKASEVHHLQPQKKASPKNEYIVNEKSGQNFHKNHLANLLNICEACHKTIHKTNAEHTVVKTSQGYIVSKL